MISLKPLPNGLQVGVQACLFVGIISRSRALHVFLFLPVLGMSMYMILFTTTGKDSKDQVSWALITTTLFQGSDMLLINDVAEFRLVGQKTPTNDLTLFQRYKWALRLLTAPRAIGWAHEPRHVLPEHPPENQRRWDFLKKQSLSVLTYFIITDIVHTSIALYPPFQRNGISLASGIYPIRLLNTALFFARIWAHMSFYYTLTSVVAVALHITEPSEWPPLFGRWSDAYTVNRFWSRTWHQVFRRVLSTHGGFVTYKVLKLRKGTLLANIAYRYAAFLVSAVIHAVSDYGMFREEFWEKSGTLNFFLLHATVVNFESEMAKILKFKPTPLLRRLGYLWTILWFVHTLPPFADPQFRYGAIEITGLPISVSHRLLRGRWSLVT